MMCFPLPPAFFQNSREESEAIASFASKHSRYNIHQPEMFIVRDGFVKTEEKQTL